MRIHTRFVSGLKGTVFICRYVPDPMILQDLTFVVVPVGTWLSHPCLIGCGPGLLFRVSDMQRIDQKQGKAHYRFLARGYNVSPFPRLSMIVLRNGLYVENHDIRPWSPK